MRKLASATFALLLAVGGLAVGSARAAQLADTTPPTIQQPPNITVSATEGCAETFCAVVTFSLTVTDPDNTPDQITINCTGPSGQTLPAGTAYDTCQAQDPAGNFSKVSFYITVTVPPPTFQNVPGPITLEATSAEGAVVTFTPPTAIDVSNTAVPVTCDHASGITYPIGTTTVTCTATITRHDSVGNLVTFTTGTTQFTVTVTATSGTSGSSGSSGGTGGTGGGTTGTGGTSGGTSGSSGSSGGTSGSTSSNTSDSSGSTSSGTGVGATQGGSSTDSSAPVLRRHTAMRIDATGPQGARVHYAITATDPDNTPAQIVISCRPASGSLFPLAARARTKTTTVTCNAHDPAGNHAKPEVFRVTVLGVHDQIVALEHQVRAARTVLSKHRRSALASDLGLANRYYAAGATYAAKKHLDSFMAEIAQLPVSLKRAPTHWIAEAARIVTVARGHVAPKVSGVTVPGVHDQIVALEHQVRAARTGLSKHRRSSLVSTLGLANRYFAAGAKYAAKKRLDTFIQEILRLPKPLKQAPTKWITEATSILAAT